MYKFKYILKRALLIFTNLISSSLHELLQDSFSDYIRFSLLLPTARGVDPGGGGGSRPPPPPPNENIGGGGQTYRFAHPIILTTCKIHNMLCKNRLKSTVNHYKTIKFNIKILLNIHNYQFGARSA